ncbi:HindIII family type II restriction endonuclease [Caldibacillus debilis]|uniref:HindIII restriction endonuclease n=1 Tax=Caldibacillus debilis GB1 TaxID=1339248 RepID=A0A420VDZ8_9BACI|nr:HindIII family type II restriction endonuclease [Caldibacillus debilis]RKO61775.1 HindIII restriction endonuclease [Caldibacillus debilis GB1]
MEYRLHEWMAKRNLSAIDTDQLVSRFKRWLRSKSDSDIQEILMTAFIPDDYEEDGEREKIFSKLVETAICEIFRRIGFRAKLVKPKNETEDIQITIAGKTILVDAKTFRLGRSQIAPNVKDFIKLHTFRTWILNYNLRHRKAQAIGGLVVYPSYP